MGGIIITGVNSFVGRNILPVISEQYKEKVIGTYNNNLNISSELKSKLRLLKINLTNESEYKVFPQDVDVIIHCAAASSNHNNLKTLITSNVISMLNIIEFAKKNDVKKIIFLSSMSVYGDIYDEIVDENTNINNPDIYGITKRIGESLLDDVANSIASVSIRLPAVIGIGAVNHWPSTILKKAKKNETIEIFNPESKFNNVVDINSLVNFFIKLINSKWNGAHAFPISCKNYLSIKDTVNSIIEAVDSRSLVIIKDSNKKTFLVDNSKAIEFGYEPRDISIILNNYAC